MEYWMKILESHREDPESKSPVGTPVPPRSKEPVISTSDSDEEKDHAQADKASTEQVKELSGQSSEEKREKKEIKAFQNVIEQAQGHHQAKRRKKSKKESKRRTMTKNRTNHRRSHT